MRNVLLLFLAVALGGCTNPIIPPFQEAPVPAADASSERMSEDLATALAAALDFLYSQHDPTTGLLVESNVVATDTRWIMTDNRLAALAFAAAGAEPPPGLLEALDPHATTRHGVIEVLGGGRIDLPIRTATAITLTAAPLVKLEQRNGVEMEDWEQYADLLLYATLDAYKGGDTRLAADRYEQALAMFDGTGFVDLAYRADGVYATYKNALAIIVGQRLGQPLREDVLAALLASQEASGGFITRYNPERTTADDANTETTALAVLALAALLD